METRSQYNDNAKEFQNFLSMSIHQGKHQGSHVILRELYIIIDDSIFIHELCNNREKFLFLHS